MGNFLEDWSNESDYNKKLCAQEDLIMNVTEDLLVLMEKRGVSKAELARKLSKSRSYVTQLLDGARNMTLRSLADICLALDAEPALHISDANTDKRLNGPVFRAENWVTVDGDGITNVISANFGSHACNQYKYDINDINDQQLKYA